MKPEDLKGIPATAEITGFMATSDGIALARSFSKLRSPKLRRVIVALVEDITAG